MMPDFFRCAFAGFNQHGLSPRSILTEADDSRGLDVPQERATKNDLSLWEGRVVVIAFVKVLRFDVPVNFR